MYSKLCYLFRSFKGSAPWFIHLNCDICTKVMGVTVGRDEGTGMYWAEIHMVRDEN